MTVPSGKRDKATIATVCMVATAFIFISGLWMGAGVLTSAAVSCVLGAILFWKGLRNA